MAITNPKGAHHVEHETGGVDAIAALSGAVITTGTVPDARLSANVPLKNAPNTFTGDQTISKAAPNLILVETAQPADQRLFRVFISGPILYIQATTDNMGTQQGVVSIDRAGILTAAGLGGTPLSGSQITVGTVPDARLSGNVPLKNVSNIFTAGPQELSYISPIVYLNDTAGAANQKLSTIIGSGGNMYLGALSDGGIPQGPGSTYNLTLDRNGNVLIGANVYEKARLTPIGHWIDLTPSLTVIGSGSVALVTNTTCRYTLIGKTQTLAFDLTITVTGTPSAIGLGLPAGANNPTHQVTTSGIFSGSTVSTMLRTVATDPRVIIYRDGSGPLFAAGTITVSGEITFSFV